MRPPVPAGGPTHTSIVSYTLHWLPDWGRRLTHTFFNLPYRGVREVKDSGCGKSMRITPFSRPLKCTVIRLISALYKSSSGLRKTYLVIRYCLFHVPNTTYDISSSRRGCPGRMTSSKNATRYMSAHKTLHKGVPTRIGVPRRGMPRQPQERPLHRVP